MFVKSQDPANKIYMSAAALSLILDASEAPSVTVTEESTGRETESKITGTLSATYTFADTEAYYAFEEEVRELGLDDSYTVSSGDISSYESSLSPLNMLSTMAKSFLIVILIIGSIILVVLNIFNIRERKYEVGVLTAMGMKKWKVAAQFSCELLVITMTAVALGAGIGAVSSVPITNALLASQTESQNAQKTQIDVNFGRTGNIPGMPGGMKNVILSMDIAGYKTEDKKTRALDLLESVGLDESEAGRRVLKLSGGQQQRVAIARALSYDPRIILADEPTGNLDRDTQREIMDIFRSLAEAGKCVILVSHSPDVATLCDETFELIKLTGKKERKNSLGQQRF